MSLLDVKDVSKHFGGVTAVSGMSFNVDRGEIVGLIGPNGAGKSSLFNLISGAAKPDTGSIRFDDADITPLAPDTICRRGIARTFQLVKAFNQLTPLQNVMVGRVYGSEPAPNLKKAREEAEEILTLTGLAAKHVKAAGTLGLVDRKRLEIARALAARPKLLLLDEMMAGLNLTEMDAAIELIRGIRDSGVTLIVVEHVMKVIMSISDRIIVMETGEKIADGRPDEVMRDPRVVKAYLGKGRACQ